MVRLGAERQAVRTISSRAPARKGGSCSGVCRATDQYLIWAHSVVSEGYVPVLKGVLVASMTLNQGLRLPVMDCKTACRSLGQGKVPYHPDRMGLPLFALVRRLSCQAVKHLTSPATSMRLL